MADRPTLEPKVRAADVEPVDLMRRHLMQLLKTGQPIAPDTHDEPPHTPTACMHDALADVEGGPPHKLKAECRPEADTMRRFLAHVVDGGDPLPPKPRRRR